MGTGGFHPLRSGKTENIVKTYCQTTKHHHNLMCTVKLPVLIINVCLYTIDCKKG